MVRLLVITEDRELRFALREFNSNNISIREPLQKAFSPVEIPIYIASAGYLIKSTSELLDSTSKVIDSITKLLEVILSYSRKNFTINLDGRRRKLNLDGAPLNW
ncbi:hypothetical protein HGB07_05320 [Candidatus Roizmanbacteria bacterium]|nr:hypothetical protein [Candidatus Roizmanbacteria bacterium]